MSEIKSLGSFPTEKEAIEKVILEDLANGVSEPEIRIKYCGCNPVTLYFECANVTGTTAEAVVWF